MKLIKSTTGIWSFSWRSAVQDTGATPGFIYLVLTAAHTLQERTQSICTSPVRSQIKPQLQNFSGGALRQLVMNINTLWERLTKRHKLCYLFETGLRKGRDHLPCTASPSNRQRRGSSWSRSTERTAGSAAPPAGERLQQQGRSAAPDARMGDLQKRMGRKDSLTLSCEMVLQHLLTEIKGNWTARDQHLQGR